MLRGRAIGWGFLVLGTFAEVLAGCRSASPASPREAADRPAGAATSPSPVRHVRLDAEAVGALLAGRIDRLPDLDAAPAPAPPPREERQAALLAGPDGPIPHARRSRLFETFLERTSRPLQAPPSDPAPVDGGFEATTAHFWVATDGGTEATQSLAGALDRFLEAFWALLADPLGAPLPERPLGFVAVRTSGRYRSLVRAIPDAPDYVERTRGIYDAESGVVIVLAEPDLAPGPAVLHEACHQALGALLDGGRSPPAWLVEGLASYCETAAAGSDGRYAFGAPHAVRLYRLSEVLRERGSLGVAEVLALDPSTFIGSDLAAGNLHYALAWALVHYLVDEERGTLLALLGEARSGGVVGGAGEGRLGPPEELEARCLAHLRALPGAALR